MTDTNVGAPGGAPHPHPGRAGPAGRRLLRLAPARPGSHPSRSGAPRLRRAQRVLLGVVAASVLVAAGGLIGAAWVRSPAQLAAQIAPPPPTVLTAPVVRQVVNESVVTRGTVTAAHQVTATPASELGATRLVITQVNKPAGARVVAGDVLVTISGRPLFALAGAFPAWRNLTPGESGPDVTQLQTALAGLGLSSAPDARGFYGSGTKDAVAALYTRLGFPAPHAGASAAALQAARDKAAHAQQVQASDQAAARRGPAGRTARARLAADARAAAAAAQAYASLAARSGPMIPMSEVVFVPSFPATVTAVSGTVGSLVSAPLVTLDSGRPDISAQLDPSDRSLLRAGQPVTAYDSATGWRAAGTVASVGAVTTGTAGSGGSAGSGSTGTGADGSGPAGSGSAGSDSGGSAQGSGAAGTSGASPYLPVTISLHGRVPAAELGGDVQVTVVYAHSHGPVLTVPEAAVRTYPDGRAYVLVKTGRAGQRRVPVTAGISGGGRVAVTPGPGAAGRLTAGDSVVTSS